MHENLPSIAVLDMIVLRRKAMQDEICEVSPTIKVNEWDVTNLISTFCKGYIKKLFPGCYCRRNLCEYSIRLDSPVFEESMGLFNRNESILRKSEYFDNSEEQNMLINKANYLLSLFRQSGLRWRYRYDGKIFVYIPHSVSVYIEHMLYSDIVESMKRLSAEFHRFYAEEYSRCKEIIDTAVSKRNEILRQIEEERRRRKEEEERSKREQEEERRRQEQQAAEEERRRVEQRLNELLTMRRQTEVQPRRVILRPVNIAAEEHAALIDVDTSQNTYETIDEEVLGSIRMLDYVVRAYEENYSITRTEAAHERVHAHISNMFQVPNSIPTSNIHVMEEFLDSSKPLPEALEGASDGVYYVASEQVYYFVVDGVITDKVSNFHEVETLYNKYQKKMPEPEIVVYIPIQLKDYM